MNVRATATLAIVVATAATPIGSDGAVDLVILNGNVITMASGIPHASAIAIAGDRIVAVGDADTVDPLVGAGTRVIDVGGATVIPGLVDAHSHFFEEGIRQGIGSGIQDTEILNNGITTTAELHTGPDLLRQMEAYDEDGELRVRTSLYLTATDACGNLQGDWWKAHPPTRDPGEMLRIGGIKVFADGGACNVPAVSYQYEDGSTGDLYFDVDQMEAIIREIDAEGHQAAVHALGDRAVATVLAAMERVIGDSGNPLRHRIEHSAVVGPDLYGRHQAAGVVAVVAGAFRTCFFSGQNDDYRYRTPDEFLTWEWPWRQLLDSNPETTFAWHADFPALPASPGANLAGFVTRVDGECLPPPAVAGGVVGVDEALAMMTLGSAYALGRDEEVGSLEVAKFADLVVLNQDPTAVDPLTLGSTEALMTMVGGQVEFCRDGHERLCEATESGTAVDPPVEPTGAADSAPCTATSVNQALDASVSASASLPDRPPTHAVDGDVETGWGAGAGPEQWIEIDLGERRDVGCIRLIVDQFPAGRTIHRVTGGADPGPPDELGLLDSVTETGQVLELTGRWHVRHLRVTTVLSPSWVAWFEIAVS